MNSNERPLQNQNRALHSTESKTPCEQIEMLNNRRHKKLPKQVAKESNELDDRYDQL